MIHDAGTAGVPINLLVGSLVLKSSYLNTYSKNGIGWAPSIEQLSEVVVQKESKHSTTSTAVVRYSTHADR